MPLFSIVTMEVIPMEYETVNMVLARYKELLELNEAKIEESADML
jgi:ribosomal protein S6